MHHTSCRGNFPRPVILPGVPLHRLQELLAHRVHRTPLLPFPGIKKAPTISDWCSWQNKLLKSNTDYTEFVCLANRIYSIYFILLYLSISQLMNSLLPVHRYLNYALHSLSTLLECQYFCAMLYYIECRNPHGLFLRISAAPDTVLCIEDRPPLLPLIFWNHDRIFGHIFFGRHRRPS